MEPTEMEQILLAHFWTSTDETTCSCGWLAPGWTEMHDHWTDDQDEPLMDAAARAFVRHQAAALEAGLGGEENPPECPTCGKRQWPVIHSCPGVRRD